MKFSRRLDRPVDPKRPTVVHLLHGTWTELRESGYVKEYREGESWAEGRTTTHWAENRGTVPAVSAVRRNECPYVSSG